MPIRVACAGCGATFQVGDEYAGRRGKCPRCREPVAVPAADPPAPAAAPEEDLYRLADAPAEATTRAARARAKAAASPKATRTGPTRTPAEILGAFRGPIRPVRPTLLYRAWIAVVALVMIALPLVYVALIGLVGYALYLHAVHDLAVFRNVRNVRFSLLVYVGPLVVGGIVVAFMLKPLFARPAKRFRQRALDPAKEPLIFAFVDGVCQSVGAPTPERIEVDCQVNASARLESGPLMPSRRLVLTIGLPLVAGLTLPQFAGVLAHEFGHFAQGAGMRLSQLIWQINRWFARVVYERDEWDETLAGWSSDGDLWVVLVVGLARVAVWLTRKVLWVLMQIGRVVSGAMSRQMEYDADRYEARMAGGSVFAATTRRLGELSLAERGAYGELEASWRDRRLPDDLPRLVASNVERIPDEIRQQFWDASRARKTGLFDTHPADADRIARAQKDSAEGIFALEGPATDLFRDFEGLARDATFDHYRAMLGPNITRDQLYPLEEAIANREVAKQEGEAFGRYFVEALSPVQALPLPAGYPAAPADLKAAKRELAQARADVLARREANHAANERWGEAFGRLAHAEAAVALLKAGNKLKAADYGLTKATPEAAEAARDAGLAELQALAADFAPFAEAIARRLTLALGLLEAEAVQARVPDAAERREEAQALYPVAAHLGGRIAPELGRPLAARQALLALARQYQSGGNEKNEALVNALLRAGGTLHERLTELKWKLGEAVPYPFEHAQERMTLGKYALPALPDRQAIGDLMESCGEAHERLTSTAMCALGRLAATGEAVETALGLPPLVVPGAENAG